MLLAESDDFVAGPPLSGLPSAGEVERRRALAAAPAADAAERSAVENGDAEGEGECDEVDVYDGDESRLSRVARDRLWRRRMVQCTAADSDACAPMRKEHLPWKRASGARPGGTLDVLLHRLSLERNQGEG